MPEEPKTSSNSNNKNPLSPKSIQTLLGIDFGLKRIGLAIGQTVTETATPLETITVNKQASIEQFQGIIEEWQPDAIVIGYPLHADDSETSFVKQVNKFGSLLKKWFDLPIYYENEYLSSAEAESLLRKQRQLNIKTRKNNKYDIDKYAAALILQRWLTVNKNHE